MIQESAGRGLFQGRGRARRAIDGKTRAPPSDGAAQARAEPPRCADADNAGMALGKRDAVAQAQKEDRPKKDAGVKTARNKSTTASCRSPRPGSPFPSCG